MKNDIKTLLADVFEKHHVPMKYEKQKRPNEHAFSCGYRFSEAINDPLIFTVWAQDFPKEKAATNYQITFRFIAKLDDDKKRAEALELINEFNETMTGPYTALLDRNNQLYLHLLGITTAEERDIEYIHTLVQFGIGVAARVYQRFEKELNGREAPVHWK